MHFTKVLFFAFCLIFTTYLCKAQANKAFSGDTAFSYRILYQDGDKIGAKHLISDSDKFHFRLWKNYQLIDIWTTDGTTYNGTVISYIKSYVPDDSKQQSQKDPKFFFNKDYIDSLTAKKATDLVLGISTIPTDKLIKGWTQGCDGVDYIMEVSTPFEYSFRSYWTPTAQDSSLIQAKQIQAFVNSLDTLLHLKDKFKNFFNSLKPGYYTDGFIVSVKLTDKQKEYYNRTKPYRDYLNSINDTLNHYLSDTLTTIFKKYGGLKCYDEFYLLFSKDNKLLKVTTNSKFDDKEDKREFLKCKKLIENAFRSIKIDFVHSQVGYIRELSFYDGKASVFSSNSWL